MRKEHNFHQNVPMYRYKSSCEHPAEIFSLKLWKNFCWISGIEEKIVSLPENFFVKIFVWTCTTNFWQACRSHACKSTKDFFRSKSENDSSAKFSKRSIFSFISLLQKIKKKLHLGTQNAVVTTLPEKSCQNYENILLEFRNWWKSCALPQQSCFSQKRSSNMNKKFWQAWRNFVAKKRKTFPNSKNVEVSIFWTNLFFSSKMIL